MIGGVVSGVFKLAVGGVIASLAGDSGACGIVDGRSLSCTGCGLVGCDVSGSRFIGCGGLDCGGLGRSGCGSIARGSL